MVARDKRADDRGAETAHATEVTEVANVGGEFDLIARYFAPLAHDPAAFGLLDDAALLQVPEGYELVLTKDAIAQSVHYLPDDPPCTIAQKLVRTNISDLIAKGATPYRYCLATGFGSGWDARAIADFSAGLAEDQALYGWSLLGGDTIKLSETTVFSLTAFGLVPKGGMVRRSGARPGDALYMTGTLGDAALGLELALGAIDPKEHGLSISDVQHFVARYRVPEPPFAGLSIVREHANAAMDLSDGLLGDARKLAVASGVGLCLSPEALPYHPAMARFVAEDARNLALAMTGGDDYQVLCTVSPDHCAAFTQGMQAAGVQATRIGHVQEAGSAGPDVVVDGVDAKLFERGSYTHF